MAQTFDSMCAGGMATANVVMGANVTLRNVVRRAVVNKLDVSAVFMPGGEVLSQPISVHFETMTFSPAITTGERVTVSGTNYVVRQITPDDATAGITLICDLPGKR